MLNYSLAMLSHDVGMPEKLKGYQVSISNKLLG